MRTSHRLFFKLLFIVIFTFGGYQRLVLAQVSSCSEIFKVRDQHDIKNWNPNTTLAIYRFFDNGGLTKSHLAAYQLKSDGFEPIHGGTLEIKGPHVKNADLLERLQNFSTEVMTQQGIITKEVRDRQPVLLNDIGPSQMTFIEISQPVPTSTFGKGGENGSIPTYRISDLPSEIMPGYRFVREAAMWLVSGQYTFRNSYPFSEMPKNQKISWQSNMKEAENLDLSDPYLIKVAEHGLPWQRNKKLLEMKTLPFDPIQGIISLDRKRFPIVFEIGRAAQLEVGRFDEMMKIMSSVMVNEVTLMLQSQIHQAHVFANVANPKLVSRFKAQGFKELEGTCLNGGPCILFLPLKYFIELYPPFQNSAVTKDLRKYTPHLDVIDTQGLRHLSQAIYRSDVDFLMKDVGLIQKTPLVIRDVSVLNRFMLSALARRMGVSEAEEVAFIHSMQRWQHDLNTLETNFYKDDIPIENFKDFLKKENLVHISNLDSTFADRSDYIPRLLVGIDQFLLQRISEWKIHPRPEDLLAQAGFNYVLQTTSASMAKNIRQYGGRGEIPAFQLSDGRWLYTFLFSRSAVRDYGKILNPLPPSESHPPAVQQGYWFFRYFNKLPWIY